MVEGQSIEDTFHTLEKHVVGYENYVNCEQDHFKETVEGLRQLVVRIQYENVFSSNEELKEVDTNHIKLLMVPFYEAEVLNKIMDDRRERVQLADTFYLEYLNLMNHYKLLEPHQVKAWKAALKERKEAARKEKDLEDEDKPTPKMHPMELLGRQFEDRDAKIAEFKLKKQIEQQLDKLKDYKDEEMKREFYMVQIRQSILKAFEQLKYTFMELGVLKHQAQLTPEQHEANKVASMQKDNLPPLETLKLGPGDVKKLPYMMQPPQGHQSQQCSNCDCQDGQQMQEVVQEYKDPLSKQKQIERIQVQHDDINDRMSLKQQYQKQVFQPSHNLPTKSLEQLAEEEMADAMERQAKDQERDMERANEDPDSEAVLERERLKAAEFDDYKDFNPKGKGNTKRM